MTDQMRLFGECPPGRRAVKPLSKSRIAAGLQCAKRLYLESYAPHLRDPIDPGRQALLDTGRRVGEVARGRVEGGALIAEGPRDHDAAVRHTRDVLRDAAVPAVYEAAFTHEDIRIRADILARAPRNRWDLIEVKSSTGFKEDYLPDVTVQLHVLEGSGVPVRSAGLLHINSGYVWKGGPYDARELFGFVDLTEEARSLLPSLLEEVAAMRQVVAAAEPPEVRIGLHCWRPYPCPFSTACHANGPEHRVTGLPRLTPHQFESLEEAGIEDIRAIPPEFPGLSEIQRRVREAVLSGRPYVDPGLRDRLEGVRAPLHFLDFETCNPALPIIPGTRPFEQIPFQWSVHRLEEDGRLEHRAYLHTDRTDPRERVASTLLETLASPGAIVVYSGFEARVIKSLAETLPFYADRLLPLASERIVDLHQIVSHHYYHPEFHGSFSIKNVVPVLGRKLDYDGLLIQEGSQAALAFSDMTAPGTPAPRREELRQGLLAYCHRDTESMVHLYHALREASGCT